MMKLNDVEKAIIERLGHNLYTPDFIESWINREAENVFANAPAALQQMGANGYLEAVKMVAAAKNEKADCFAVVHSNYADGRDVYVYNREEDAKAVVEAELGTTIASLKDRGYTPILLRDGFDNPELYVKDTGIWYEWQIEKTTIE